MRQLQCAFKSANVKYFVRFSAHTVGKNAKPSIEDFCTLMLGKLLDIRTSSTEK